MISPNENLGSLPGVHQEEEAQRRVHAPDAIEAQLPAVGADHATAPAVSPQWEEGTALMDGGVGAPPDEWRIQEANRRQQILQTFAELIAQGIPRNEAAKQIGVPYTTIWRYEKAFAARGYNGLLPGTDKCGRKSWLEKLGLSAEDVQLIMGEIQGLNLDVESTTSALRIFASSDRCPAALAQVILDPTRHSKHDIPRSIRDLAKVGGATRTAHRGPRRLSLKGIYIPRKMDVLPGDVFTADDTTPIWAWWVPWRECEEYPFGVKLLQGQLLPVIDVASQCAITYSLIAREKASYRACDIWALFGHTFDQVGLPRLGWQLERGSWEANLIGGQEVTYETGEATFSRRVGGLRQLPTNPHDKMRADFAWPKTLEIFTSYLPKSKSIEAFFNRSQSLEGTLWGALGRDQMRKPFEKAKKLFQACQRGAEDPRKHFLSNTEMAVRINQLLDYLNHEPMEGEVFSGIPKQKFDNAIAENPLFQFQGDLDALRWLYKSDWAVVQITQGWARVRLTHPISGERFSLFYTNPSEFAAREGEQVAVYYDRENYEQPAQIILAKTGEFLCEAQYVERSGTFLGTESSGREVAKAWKNAVMTTYGTLVKHAPSRQLPEEISARRQAAPAGHRGEGSRTAAAATTVDRRPAPAPAATNARFGGMSVQTPTDEQRKENREQLSRQAALANQLRALTGQE